VEGNRLQVYLTRLSLETGYLRNEFRYVWVHFQPKPLRCNIKQVYKGYTSVLHIKPFYKLVEEKITWETRGSLRVKGDVNVLRVCCRCEPETVEPRSSRGSTLLAHFWESSGAETLSVHHSPEVSCGDSRGSGVACQGRSRLSHHRDRRGERCDGQGGLCC